MNISRIALLSVLFAAPMFADEAVIAQPGMISQIVNGVIVTPFNVVKNNSRDLTDFVASWTCNVILNPIANISFLKGGKIQSYLATDANGYNPTGRVLVLVAAAYAAYLAYQAYNAQNDSDDDIIFGDEYVDNN